MKIELINTHSPSFDKLKEFAGRHDLLFNSEAWIKNYPAENIRQCAILNNNNDVIGCFNYYCFKKYVFQFVITAPYSPHVELFYVNPAASAVGKNSFHKELLTLIADYFTSQKAHYVDLNLPEEITDTQPFIWKGFTSKNRFSYVLNLSGTSEELWANLSSEKRKSILKADHDKLVIKETSDFKTVFSLIIKSLAKSDKAKNTGIIKNILFSFATARNSVAFVAENNGRPVAASFCLLRQNKALYLFGGIDPEHSHHGASVSCMWQSILKAKELGMSYFDFEGSMHKGIERYFREFGGELKPYACVEKIRPGLKILLMLKGHNSI